MPSLSVLIHVQSADASLARLLETLRPADETVVVDHSASEAVRKTAREYGARVVAPVPGVERGAYAVNCAHDWVLCLLPSESLSEALEASLFEWKAAKQEDSASFSVAIREQNGPGWKRLDAETRLVNRCTVNWQGLLPPALSGSHCLSGDLLRFAAAE